MSAELLRRLVAGDQRALARAITAVENADPLTPAILAAVDTLPGRSLVIGITGPPGAGKSTLIDALITEFRRGGRTVAVLAVDPSSPISGGAILGDRIRMAGHAGDPGVFVRSIASRGHLGGLFRSAWSVLRVMEAAGPDVILVETVGTGQSEVEIAEFARVRVVVCAPGLGDEVQAIKAGVLEIADVLVVNKADHPLAARTVRELEGMLALRSQQAPPVAVLSTTASTGEGVQALARALDEAALRLGAVSEGGAASARADRALRRLLAQAAAALLRERIERGSPAGLDALCERVRR
ncbi:MAG TPA: methylmalonyl Co-A mutase-associated GTPase MeaB, partial [Quisquiliibacterium sp.]|nr:methylmalonyl Co-A mutase-associated GTPase MeaB [Quisquiliibacterium sp.]